MEHHEFYQSVQYEANLAGEAVVGTLLEHVDDEEREALRERLEELDFEGAIPESGPGARS